MKTMQTTKNVRTRKPLRVAVRVALASSPLLALVGVALLSGVLIYSGSAFAASAQIGISLCATPSPDATATPGATKPCVPNATPLPKPSPLPAGCFEDLACVKAYADQSVALRIQALDDAIARANSNPCLSDKQRAPILQQLQDGVAGVRQLQATFDAETDPKAIKADLHQLFDGLGVFSVVVPRAFSEMTLACQANALALFQTGVGAVETAIDNAAKAGKDVTAERQLFAQLQSQLADAQTQVTNATTLLGAANPAPADEMRALGQVKGDLLTATRDLQAARDELARITGLLSGKPTPAPGTPYLKPTSVPGTPKPKGSPTPTP
jgi:hypothetical protein